MFAKWEEAIARTFGLAAGTLIGMPAWINSDVAQPAGAIRKVDVLPVALAFTSGRLCPLKPDAWLRFQEPRLEAG